MFSSSVSRSVVSSSISSNARIAPVTSGGATVLLNRYGRDRCRSSSTTSARPLVNPPDAPPSALPSVPVMMSTRPITPQCSCVPRPVLPTNPVAWQSSTITSASY